MIITIDGPTASGKSTLARMLAQRLNYYYICSGLLYRALAYLLVTYYGYTEKNIEHIALQDIAACFNPDKFIYSYDGVHERILYDNQDITPYLKDSVIDHITSITSVNEHVRHCVTVLQHSLAAAHDIVIDGRDTGSAVFPAADVKFFLTASLQVRAQRWLYDQKKRGHNFSTHEAQEKVADRDRRDSERAVAPLIIPSDAHVIDNSNFTLEQTCAVMSEYVDQVIHKNELSSVE